ncbi:MAG: RNA methyltransferase [Clostridiales bacterium]|nr:RNA methyltransferase [Clostridiales bacterium]
MVIASVQNEKVKYLKKLMTEKSLVFFDNPKLLKEAYDAGHQILYVIKKEGYVGKTDYGGEVIEVTSNVFNIFTTTITSQGLIGVVKYIDKKLAKPQNNFLVLDGLQDPGNVGTLIRSALGANFKDIYLLNCAKVTNEKVIRASMGAFFKVNLYQTDLKEFVEIFKTWKLPLIVCDMHGENLYKTNFESTIGVAVGNEGNGVSKDMKNLATQIVKIPMQNNLESLNAGVSASIVMYEIANRN